VDLSSDDFATICSPVISIAPEEQKKRREAVKQMLEKSSIPHQDDGDSLVVMGMLHIDPPFTPLSCRCSNEVVLQRVQKLLETAFQS